MVIVVSFEMNGRIIATRRYSKTDIILPRTGDSVQLDRYKEDLLCGKVVNVLHQLSRKEIYVTVNI